MVKSSKTSEEEEEDPTLRSPVISDFRSKRNISCDEVKGAMSKIEIKP